MPRLRGKAMSFVGGGAAGQHAINDSQVTTIYFVGDTHYGSENSDPAPTGPPTNPNDRQIAAMNNMVGAFHPLGGVVHRPGAIIQLGDGPHENLDPTGRYLRDYGSHYIQDGNHHYVGGGGSALGAAYPIVNSIIARHGSLTWGAKIGPFYFQSMGDNPTVAQINGEIATKVNARPANEPIFFMVHRSVDSPGYEAEFEVGALDAIEDLMATRNTLGIIHAHSHYDGTGTWRGFRRISPGSVKQSPATPPYSSVFPEAFVVMRIRPGSYDIGAYVFGYDAVANVRVWSPGTWKWTEQIAWS